MKLIDTNILIYAADTHQYPSLLPIISNIENAVSVISKIEVLGFHKITPVQKKYFEALFQILPNIQLNNHIIEKAISLKQSHKMTLGDALIAATAIVLRAPLVTRNEKDFQNIPGLKIENPFSP